MPTLLIRLFDACVKVKYYNKDLWELIISGLMTKKVNFIISRYIVSFSAPYVLFTQPK